MLKNWKKKLLAILLIFTMTFSNFALVGKTYAASIFGGLFGNEKDAGDTGSSNVEFDAYFLTGETTKTSVKSDINNSDLTIGVKVKVKNSGYLKDAKILFGNGKELNFKINSEISNTIENEETGEITVETEDLIEKNEKVQKFENNELYFIQLNSDSEATAEFPISYEYQKYVEESKISKSNEIKFEGTYVSDDAEEIPVSKVVNLKLSWEDNRSSKVSSEVTKYIGYSQDGVSGIILQTLVKADNRTDGISLPVKDSKVSIDVPVIDNVKPDTINVVAKSTLGTNGKQNDEVSFDENNWNYDEAENVLTIQVSNEPELVSTQNEDDVLIDETAPMKDMYYSASGTDEYLITYTYSNVEMLEREIDTKIISEFNMFGDNNLTSENEETYKVSDQIGDIVTYTNETSTNSVSKGYTYLNYNNDETKYEIEIDNKLIFNVSYKDIVESLYYSDISNTYTTKSDETFNQNDIYYKSLSLSKENFDNMLGEKGFVNIKDSQGNLIFTINNETEANENGNYEVKFDNSVKNIQIETSKPINDGNIIFGVLRAYSDVSYNKDNYKNFDKLTINTIGKAKYIYLNDYADCGVSNLDVKLEDTTTKAELEVGQNSLSTLAMNNNVELKIELNNENIDSDVYGESTFQIKMPEYIETVEVTDASIVYGEGLEISSVEGFEQDGNMYLNVGVTGAQKSLSSGIVSNGTNIVLNANIKVDLFAPATEGNFELTYVNSEATSYEEEAEVGYDEAQVTYSAPSGVVSVNSTYGYSDDGRTLTSVNQGTKQDEILIYSNSKNASMELTIMNNEKNDISNIAILGRIPFEGVKDILNNNELGTTLTAKMTSPIVADDSNNENFKVYYSENGNATKDLDDSLNGWTENIDNLDNVKSYLIVPEDDNYTMDEASKIRFTYNYEIPENLEHNEEIYGTFATYYTNNTKVANVNDVSVADLVGLTTGEGPEFDFETTVNKTSISELEELEITSVVKNTGKTVASNVSVEVPIPEHTSYVLASSSKENASWLVTDSKVLFNLESLDVNDTVTFKIVVKVGQLSLEDNVEENSTEVSAILTAKDFNTSLQSDIVKVDIKTAELELTIDNSVMDGIIYKGTNVKLLLRLQNLKDELVKNGVVTLKLEDGFIYKEATVLGYSEDGVTITDVKDAEYNPQTKMITWKVDEIDSLDIVTLKVLLDVDDIEGNETTKTVSLVANAKADGTEEYASGVREFVIGKPVLTITQTTSTTNSYVKEGQTINYKFAVKNEGSVTAQSVRLTDTIPTGLVVKSISYEANGIVVNKAVSEKDLVTIGASIAPGDTLDVNIAAVATSLNGIGERSVTNSAKVKAENVNEIESNYITHIVESSGNTVSSQGETSTGTASSSTDETTSSINKTYKISGTAWLDKNNDGMRTSDEQLMRSIQATLVDSDNGVIKQTTYTNSNGEYTFSGVRNGNYIIIFDYDTVLYTVTVYQKENVTSNVNSDVITTKIEQDGVLRNGAVTDVITVADGSISNIDIGLIEALKFDLSLNMGITKTTVQNKAGTNTKNYENAKLTKTEIGAKQMAGSVVYIEYTLTVKNEGEISGYAKKIVDYLPEDMQFNSGMNEAWYTGTDGNLYTTQLSNVELQPGESRTFKLVLTRTMTEENTGVVSNTAEIVEDYNIYGVSDLDSTPANKAQNEDDFARVDSYLSVKTGEVFIYISLIITTIILIGIASSVVVLKLKYRLNKGGV